MTETRDKLLSAMRKRQRAALEFDRLTARLAERRERDHPRLVGERELLAIAEALVQLLTNEITLNERLTAWAMGLQEAGTISSDELNVLMGLI